MQSIQFSKYGKLQKMILPPVIVLAGGLGTRLRPFTYCVPKPMVKVCDKPFLYYLLRCLKSQRVTKVTLALGYLADTIINYCQNLKNFGLDITYSVESRPLGTGGAVKLAARHVHSKEFFLVNGDTFLPLSYRRMYSCYLKSKKMGVLAVYDNSKQFLVPNNVLINDGNIIDYDRRLVDKMNFVDAGIGIFSNSIFYLFR